MGGKLMSFADFGQVLKSAGKGFVKNKVPKLSASLCFYALFSIGPMLLIIIYISGLVWGRQAIEGTIYTEIVDLIGDKAAGQIQEVLKNTTLSQNNLLAVFGIITMIFAATTGFYEVHDSINTIWNLKVKKGRALKQMVKTRLMSFLIISALGVLMIFLLIINGLIESFLKSLREMFPDASVIVVYVANILVTLMFVALLFAVIFKLMPDAYIKWKYVITGAVFTAFLFMIGKYGFTIYLTTTDMGSAYGPAGSLVVLILWVYYSATVLYFGAEFTKAYAIRFGDEIRPKEYAVTVKVVKVESNQDSIQKNEKENE